MAEQGVSTTGHSGQAMASQVIMCFLLSNPALTCQQNAGLLVKLSLTNMFFCRMLGHMYMLNCDVQGVGGS